jgi:copper oxidase (laccase) domain-containing protein
MKVFSLWNDEVRVVLTDKSDGNMRDFGASSGEVVANQARALTGLGATLATTARVLVNYERADFARYFYLRAVSDFAMSRGEGVSVGDGILTDQPNLAMFLPLADCLGVVLYDSANGALMVAHVGRHNLEQAGLTRAVEFMTQNVGANPADLKVWFSPSANGENYPLYDFDNKSLDEVATEQLTRAGVDAKNITHSKIDTTTDPNYFSHSQGDKRERFAIVAIMVGRP